MRILLIVALLIMGCSVTSNSGIGDYTRGAELSKESQEVSVRLNVSARQSFVAKIKLPGSGRPLIPPGMLDFAFR